MFYKRTETRQNESYFPTETKSLVHCKGSSFTKILVSNIFKLDTTHTLTQPCF